MDSAALPIAKSTNESKLFTLTGIDLKDPLDCQLEESYNKLQSILNAQLSDSQLHNELIQYSNQTKQHSDEVCNALLYSILIDSTNNSLRYLRYLLLCNNNNAFQVQSAQNDPALAYGTLISNMSTIALENYSRLLDVSRQQYLWLLKELIKARLTHIDKVLFIHLRNIQGGNLSEKNIWLNEQILDILVDNLDWLYSNIELTQTCLYTYLRLIADHVNSIYNALRQREIDFCVQIIREKWNDCMQIGRDLVRLLQNLSKIPEFEQLWKEMMNTPNTLSLQFANAGGLQYILRLPTRRRFLISRLTPDMERKIFFLITSVKFGNHRRYQEWFQRNYLSTPESQSIRVDIIRYICVVVHPTNEQLNSGLTPRWLVISWLINTCTNLIECANCKLALFYDWLFYDAKKDNIMFIEPGILLMTSSLRVHTNITIMLLDFLCRIVYTYCLNYKDNIIQGITSAFRDILEKRVIPTINVFFESGKLDKEFKLFLQQTFPLIFGSVQNPPPIASLIDSQFKRSSSVTDLTSGEIQQLPPLLPTPPLSNTSGSTSTSSIIQNIDDMRVENSIISAPNTPSCTTPNFSDDDESSGPSNTQSVGDLQIIDTLNQKLLLNDMQVAKPIKVFVNEDILSISWETSLNNLNNETLNKKLLLFDKTLEVEAQCQIIDDILNEFLNNDDEFYTSDQTKSLADCLLYQLKVNFSNNLLPETYYQQYYLADDDDLLIESINKRPIFLLFKYFQQQNLTNDQSNNSSPSQSPSSTTSTSMLNERKKLLELIKYIYLKQKRLSYYYLYYIKVNNDEDFMQGYKEMVKFILNDDSHQSHQKLQQSQLQQPDLKKEKQDFEKFFMEDMKLCQQDDGDLFCFMILFIYKNFSTIVVNNSDMIFLIVNCIDSIQCKNLFSLIISDELKLLKATMQSSVKFIQCLFNSLQWDTIEQIFFWKLLFAHNNITIEYLLPLIPKLDSLKHCEAICDLFQILKLEDPTVDIVQCVLCRKEDNITRALFVYWSKNEENALKKILIKLLDKLYSHLNKNLSGDKKAVGLKKQPILDLEMPSLEQVLAHLNQLRLNNDCLKLILDETVQDNLQKLYKSFCNDDLKRRYADLFTLIDEFDENTINASKKSGSNKNAAKKQQSKVSGSGQQDKNKTIKRVKTTSTSSTKGNINNKKSNQQSYNSSTSDSDIDEPANSSKPPPRKKHKPITSDNDSD